MISKSFTLSFCLIMAGLSAYSQNYTSYFTGDTSDVQTVTGSATVLMGGATEHDSAMVWFLEHSGGGDILVLRASGSDGYNNYLFNLGVNVNSVETIVLNNANGALDPYVENQVRNCEALWFAGGDQWDYVSYFKDGPLEDAFNDLIHIKKIPIGGTSAGCAIMGDAYFNAMNGTITSTQALNNPYHQNATIGFSDFINNPYLNNVITDTHFDNPDREGRLLTFMARLETDYSIKPLAIGVDEYTAVCIDSNGLARVIGDYPTYNDYAYFYMSNCESAQGPETCSSGIPLTYDNGNNAVVRVQIPGNQSGTNWLDLADWQSQSGGSLEKIWVANGTVSSSPTAAALFNCYASGIHAHQLDFGVWIAERTLISDLEKYEYSVIDLAGRIVQTGNENSPQLSISTGVYMVRVSSETGIKILKFAIE